MSWKISQPRHWTMFFLFSFLRCAYFHNLFFLLLGNVKSKFVPDELDAKITTESGTEANKKASDENSTKSFRVAFTGKSGPGVVRNLALELAEIDGSTESEGDILCNQLFRTGNVQNYNKSSTDELKTTLDPQSTSHSTFIATSSSQAGNSSKSMNISQRKILSQINLSTLTESPIYPLNSAAFTNLNKHSSAIQASVPSILTTTEELSSIHANSTERDQIDSIDFIEESTTFNDTTSLNFADNETSHSPLTNQSMEDCDAIDVAN